MFQINSTKAGLSCSGNGAAIDGMGLSQGLLHQLQIHGTERKIQLVRHVPPHQTSAFGSDPNCVTLACVRTDIGGLSFVPFHAVVGLRQIART